MFLLKILIPLCMIMVSIVKESIFAVIVYNHLVQKEILKIHIKDCFRFHGKRKVICLKNASILNLKIMREK